LIEKRLGYREIALFFFPLLLNVQLMSISHTIINGALARLDNYVTALAGFSVAIVVHIFISSPSYQNPTISLTLIRGKKSLIGVMTFIGLVAVYTTVLMLILVATPVGDFFFLKILGTPAEVVVETKKALAIMMVLPLFTGLRSLSQGLLIKARRTGLVSFATGVRVVALLGYLSIGQLWFSGAQLGAFALASCVITESLVITWLAWKTHSPFKKNVEEKNIAQIIRYALPLAFSSFLQQTIPLLISSIVGRLSDGPLALAAFGLIQGFLFLLAGPMRNLQQAYLTLVKTERDYRTLLKFSVTIAGTLGILLILTAGPLNNLVVGKILGADPEIRLYLRFSLGACALFPIFYGGTSLLRGWFAGADQTIKLSRATIAKCCFLAIVWWPLVNFQLPVSGIAIAVGLLVSAEILEATYLYFMRQHQPLEVRQLAPF